MARGSGRCESTIVSTRSLRGLGALSPSVCPNVSEFSREMFGAHTQTQDALWEKCEIAMNPFSKDNVLFLSGSLHVFELPMFAGGQLLSCFRNIFEISWRWQLMRTSSGRVLPHDGSPKN